MNNELPEVIRTQHDGVRFCYWLAAHAEIGNVQGWEIKRTETNMPHHFGSNVADVNFTWRERASLNDWIRTYNKNPEFRARYA